MLSDDLMLQAAQVYATKWGWRVLPLYTATNGRCSCGKANCKHPGKHPRIQNWQNEATTNSAIFNSWWSQWPHAGVGIAAGAASGFFVIDVDIRNRGDITLDELEAKHGALPDTVEQHTGGGGRHLLFKHPGFEVKNNNDGTVIGAGVDIKGDGGLIVVPPTMHASGIEYTWEWSGRPDQVSIAAAPAWMLERLRAASSDNGRLKQAAAIPVRIEAGARNDTLLSFAGSMRRRGAELDEIDAALRMMNENRCDPPLDMDEVREIAQSVCRYPPKISNGVAVKLRRRPGPVEAAQIGEPYMMTDLGNAERLVARYGHDFLWVGDWGRWLVWSSKRWEPDHSGHVERLAKRTVRGIYAESAAAAESGVEDAADKAKYLAKWGRESEANARIAAMLRLARSEMGIAVTPDDLDLNPLLFNCDNGTVDLANGQLLAHDRGHLITKVTLVPFDPAAKCPRWDKFLHEIFNEEETLIDYVQRFHGYCLTGDISDQVMPVYHGVGANGKSTMLDTIMWVMGDYADLAPPDLLMVRRGDEHPTELADLYGKRLVVASESEKARKMKIQLIKRLTGDERIKGRFMRQDYFWFPRTFKVVLVTNNRPRVDEDSEAVWRRLRLVPFNVVIPKEERDKDLSHKLKTEGAGILRWMVNGCGRWRQDGLGEPTAVTDATSDYRAESDPLREFMAACGVLGANHWTASKDLRESYEKFCEESGEKPVGGRDFTDALRKHGCSPVPKSGRRGWEGIGPITTTGGGP